MREWGFLLTALASLSTGLVGWRVGRGFRHLGQGAVVFWSFVCIGMCVLAALLAGLAWVSFIENCGGGGNCDSFADWSPDSAAVVAGVPPVVAAVVAGVVGRYVGRERNSV